MSELQLKEIRVAIHKTRASSAPGPSSTSYKVHTNESVEDHVSFGDGGDPKTIEEALDSAGE